MNVLVNNRRAWLGIAAFLALALFSGCGLKGDLYLPDDPPPEIADESDGDSDDDD